MEERAVFTPVDQLPRNADTLHLSEKVGNMVMLEERYLLIFFCKINLFLTVTGARGYSEEQNREAIMAIHFGQIDAYFINMLAPKSYGGKRLINLVGSFGRAVVWFIPDGHTLPNNAKRPVTGFFDVYYHVRDWEAIVDLLRHEKPVYFNFNDVNNSAQIYTGSEPVGEGE